MVQKKKTIIMSALILLAAILAVVSWLILPDSVGMQIQAGGQLGNFMPKPVAILIPLAVTCIFAVIFYKSNGEKKNLIGSLVGIALSVITMILN